MILQNVGGYWFPSETAHGGTKQRISWTQLQTIFHRNHGDPRILQPNEYVSQIEVDTDGITITIERN